MNSIKLFLILFIVPFILSDEDSFSINPFIERLKNEGLLGIIELIKFDYGQDVAIISCEELKKNISGNCKRLVLEYIPNYDNKAITRGLPSTFMKLSLRNIKSWIKNKIMHYLEGKFSFNESNALADNILNKINRTISKKIIKKYKNNLS